MLVLAIFALVSTEAKQITRKNAQKGVRKVVPKGVPRKQGHQSATGAFLAENRKSPRKDKDESNVAPSYEVREIIKNDVPNPNVYSYVPPTPYLIFDDENIGDAAFDKSDSSDLVAKKLRSTSKSKQVKRGKRTSKF